MEFTASRRIAVGLAVAMIVASGCQSTPSGSTGATAKAMPNISQPMQDVRTEAKIQEMEMWYNAEKNSQPTRQHEAEAEAARKAKAKAAEAAKEGEKKE